MNWLLVLVLFNVQTGTLENHTERLFGNEKACNQAGSDLVSNVAYPDGLKASYICLPDTAFGQPDKKGKRFGIL